MLNVGRNVIIHLLDFLLDGSFLRYLLLLSIIKLEGFILLGFSLEIFDSCKFFLLISELLSQILLVRGLIFGRYFNLLFFFVLSGLGYVLLFLGLVRLLHVQKQV